ncbi:catalase [Fulvimarina endophytica]|uniref:Catalase n=1 Tax=Fulvimarina endophytica TaxID=2293836 RepID=A0A371WY83_9HYPH|nr:catalase family protein [Fulvimarina endophytica]RFC61957.1 catalase [Fulvimarina endophytica]
MTTSIPDPIRFSPIVETSEDDEAKTNESLEKSFDYIVRRTKAEEGRAARGVHAKNHGELVGRMRIRENLPEELAQGLFASPGEHPVILRFSTNPGDILHDEVSVPRGLAIKVLDVKGGERLPGSEGETTQDFVMINGPVFSAPSAKDFARTLKALAATTDRAEGLKKLASAFLQTVEKGLEKSGLGGSPTLQTLGGAPDTHPLGQTFFTQTAYRYGDYIAKLQFAPASGKPKALAGEEIAVKGRADALREEMNAATGEAGGTFELRVQLCRDLIAMPVEDPSVEWSEDLSPFVTVAEVTIEPQTAFEATRNERLDDEIRFSPWTGLAAHRPLGGVNRVRRRAYDKSAELRSTLNGCPFHEPKSLDEVPA